jgi:hypothetical protein
MNELIEALRRAVRAEISAAMHASAPVSDARKQVSLAERMEVERCWAQAARLAESISRNGVRVPPSDRAVSGLHGPP